MEISRDQVLGEGDYATVEGQSLYDGHALALCHSAALNAWDITKEFGKKIDSFIKVVRAQREPSQISYRDWLQQ